MLKPLSKNRLKKCRWAQIIAIILALSMLTTVAAPSVMANDAQVQGLSLNDSIKMALQHSQAVKKASKEMDRTEELRDYSNGLLDYVPVGHVGIPAVEMAYTSALTSQLTWQMSLKSYTTEEDKVVLGTCKKYWEILRLAEKIKADEIALDSALRQLQAVRVAEQVGMSLVLNLSPTQSVKAAEAQYVAAQATLAASKNDLDKAYGDFNTQIGVLVKEKTVLADSIQYQPLDVTDLEHEVSRVLETSPTIYQAEEMVSMQRMLKDITLYSSGSYRTAEARKIEVEQAELDASSAKELVGILARTLYYQTRNLEESYSGVLEGIKVAEENLRVKNLQFELGMATVAELKAEEKKLADARYQAYNLLCSHSYLKLAFQKPWAAEL